MIKRIFFLSVFSCLALLASVCSGQIGIISTLGSEASNMGGMAIDTSGNIYYADVTDVQIKKITPGGVMTVFAGNGTDTYSGDGGPATAAGLFGPYDVAIDKHGNFYIACFLSVRKISPSGVISTIAGVGYPGYAGDGGPATAAHIGSISGIAIDNKDNIYIADNEYSTLRKIDTSGIITTIAGIADSAYFSGDGGPATAAYLSSPVGVAIDAHQNIYLVDQGNARIRKIDTAGIITTIAGNGLVGISGDGGPATAAELTEPYFLKTDKYGSIVFSDMNGRVIRKIDTAGVIRGFVGSGITGSSPDGTIDINASLGDPTGIALDTANNLFFLDDIYIRKVTVGPNIIADSFSTFIYSQCSGISLTTVTHSVAADSLHTAWGDGSSQTDTVTDSAGYRYVSAPHTYNAPGTYSISEQLQHGAAVIGSNHFSYEYLLCNTLRVSFYLDANGNCVKDSSEIANPWPVSVEVDSNGIAVDTIAATSGLYYDAYGSTGDVYSFRLISITPGLVPACSGSGIVSDTLGATGNNSRSVGFVCSSAPGFDLAATATQTTGRHEATGIIIVANNYCTPQDAVVTLNIDPKYIFESSLPLPTSVAGNTVTWNFSALSVNSAPLSVSYTLTVPGAWLTAGDTIQTHYSISPVSGDLDTTNNTTTRVDTVKSSFDPNQMTAAPSGYILPGETLEYGISFENTGNDTAHNIAVMDTLPNNIDLNSLQVVAASATMKTAIYNDGAHDIVKFDFPAINLPDSSHHNQCGGSVTFRVKTKMGLDDGTTLFNYAGIFFDDNPAVITDTVVHIISLIQGANSVCTGSTIILTDLAAGGVWTASNTTATMSHDTVTGVAAGMDTLLYTITTKYGSVFTSKVITVNASPGMIHGIASVCAFGGTTSLSDVTAGGTWSSTDIAITAAGSITGSAADTATVIYTLPSGCSISTIITVNPVPSPITGAGGVCVGSATPLAVTPAGGYWMSSNAAVATADTGVLSALSAGTASITYTLATGCRSVTIVTVSSTPGAITGALSLCAGATTHLSDVGTGGTWNSSTTGIATVATIGASTGVVIGIGAGVDTVSYIVTPGCIATALVTVYAVPALSVNAIPAGCGSSFDLVSAGALSYVWSPAAGIVCGTCATNTVNPMVTTVYTVTGTGAHGCATTETIMVNANRIAGHITAGSAATDTMKVWLIRFNPADSAILAEDSMLTCVDGGIPYYEFDGIAPGHYLLRASLLGSVPGVSGYAPSYGMSSPYWDTASVIVHASATDTQHISMIHGIVPAGAGAISGSITTDAATPVAGMLVYLMNTTNEVLTYAYTDVAGNYSFSGLADGSYYVYPEDYKYYTTKSAAILLSAAGEIATGISFKQHNVPGTITPYSGLSVSAQSISEGISVFPNPASGRVSIAWQQQVPGDASVIITDMAGREVYRSSIELNAASGQAQVDISILKEGIYILSVRSGSIDLNCKLLVD